MFQSPVIMQSVKSTQVAKPVLQTAGAPLKPVNHVVVEQAVQAPTPAAPTQTVVAPDRAAQMETPPPPSYEFSIQQKQQQVRMLLQHIFSNHQRIRSSSHHNVPDARGDLVLNDLRAY